MELSNSRPVRLSAACALVLLLAACTNAAVDKAVGVTDDTSAIVIARSDIGVVVDNQAGRPMLNVRLQIDGEATFIHVLPALDAGARREVRFAEFRTEDGGLFEPGYFTPKQIKATARDTLGNSYDVTVPW